MTISKNTLKRSMEFEGPYNDKGLKIAGDLLGRLASGVLPTLTV